MATSTSFLLYYLIACICFSLAIADDGRKAYIVYMGSLPSEAEYAPFSHHLSILKSISPGNSIIRSYTNSFNGFVARLSEAEKEKLVRLNGVVSVFPDRKLKLQTTRSWDFMGFPLNVERRNTVESDIIIGVIDSGIWPESKSFNGGGFGSIPTKWKGGCPKPFPCNKKLIGARDLTGNSSDPRDNSGRGTHTASTAAGSIVDGANFYGLANRSARGAVPSPRIAAYKVCDPDGCYESAMLAGFDTAIKDGVDILSVSLNPKYPASPFSHDSVAIGGFHAVEKGILTVQSAGNGASEFGRSAFTVTSVAPWLFTVGASTIDRRIVSNTVLGNGKTLIGDGINTHKLGEVYSLISAEDAHTSSCTPEYASSCSPECLDRKLVQGKILICNSAYGIDGAKNAGAVASIYMSMASNVSYIFHLPSSGVTPKDFFQELLPYLNNSKTSAKGTIRPTESLFDSGAPTVAGFSSRGPNIVAPDVLKPDISAPGVDILAAISPHNLDGKSFANFGPISGTSVACPHVAGASAYVKSFRPTWSPSAIKSALMTTARAMSPAKNPDAELAYGAGHIDPVKALNPGLVYETDTDDYINFFCKLGYNASAIELITGRATPACPKGSEKTSPPVDVNYPTLAAQVNLTKPFRVVFRRTVTNVGDVNSTYKAGVSSSPKIRVSVEPSTLSFKSLNEKLSFNVTVTGSGSGEVKFKSMETASLEWFDGLHRVRSPIVVYQEATFSAGR